MSINTNNNINIEGNNGDFTRLGETFWYRDDGGSLYDTEFQRALKLGKFPYQYPNLNPEHNPLNFAYEHNENGSYRFKTKMVRRPFDAYLLLYNIYTQLTNKDVKTPEDKELIKRHKGLMQDIRVTFNTMRHVVPGLPPMLADRNTLQLTNEDNVRGSIVYLEQLFSNDYYATN